jgi:hypothetical protein
VSDVVQATLSNDLCRRSPAVQSGGDNQRRWCDLTVQPRGLLVTNDLARPELAGRPTGAVFRMRTLTRARVITQSS